LKHQKVGGRINGVAPAHLEEGRIKIRHNILVFGVLTLHGLLMVYSRKMFGVKCKMYAGVMFLALALVCEEYSANFATGKRATSSHGIGGWVGSRYGVDTVSKRIAA
jgi:hypothetical protein